MATPGGLGLGGGVVAVDYVGDGQGRAEDGQGGQGEEGDRFGVGRYVAERVEGVAGRRPGRRPARFRYRVPNVATPTSRPSWFTVTTTPVASAASSTGTLISTRVISGLNAAAIPAPVMAPIR